MINLKGKTEVRKPKSNPNEVCSLSMKIIRRLVHVNRDGLNNDYSFLWS